MASARTPEGNAPEVLARSVHDAMRSLLRRLGPVLEEERISMGQFWGLHAVSSLGPSSVHAVARRLLVSPPTACANVDALERAGLLERRRSEADRRVVEVALTAKGRQAEARIWRAVGRAMRDGTRGLPAEDVAVAARVFRSVVDRLEADGAERLETRRAS